MTDKIQQTKNEHNQITMAGCLNKKNKKIIVIAYAGKVGMLVCCHLGG